MEQELADETVLAQRRAELEAAVEQARLAESALEASLREDLPALSRAQETWFGLSAMQDRLQGTASLAAERVRNADSEPEPVAGRDPDELEAEAQQVRAQEQEITGQVQRNRAALEEALAARQAAEDAHGAEERRVAGLQRAAADRREGLARLQGQVNAKKSRVAATQDELGRLEVARAEAAARAERAERDFTSLESRVAGLDAGEEGLDAEHEVAMAALEECESTLTKMREEAQAAERERAALVARREALELGLSRKDGSGALLAATEPVSGLLGSVAALVEVRSGYEAAVAAALGAAADAVVVDDLDHALDALGRLKSEDLGRAGMVLGGASADRAGWPSLPAGASYAVDALSCPEQIRGALQRLLDRVAVVDDAREARSVVRAHPELVCVTRAGDLLGAHFVAGGSSTSPSLLEVQAALDEAEARIEEVTHAAQRLAFELNRAEQERHDAAQRAEVALAKLHESDAHLAAVAEELAQHGSTARGARAEVARLERATAEAVQARDADVAGLAELEERLANAEAVEDEEPDVEVLERLAQRGP